jgi:hypothetical protein
MDNAARYANKPPDNEQNRCRLECKEPHRSKTNASDYRANCDDLRATPSLGYYLSSFLSAHEF